MSESSGEKCRVSHSKRDVDGKNLMGEKPRHAWHLYIRILSEISYFYVALGL